MTRVLQHKKKTDFNDEYKFTKESILRDTLRSM